MDSHGIEHVRKSVRAYVAVFAGLMVLTVITVGVAQLHLSTGLAIAVALIIASVKATLVASYFMHLISEKNLIYATLLLTTVFVLALFFLPLSHYLDGGGV
jgi:cytochrome c oxidase subunit 4